jgi:hypothetical protein
LDPYDGNSSLSGSNSSLITDEFTPTTGALSLIVSFDWRNNNISANTLFNVQLFNVTENSIAATLLNEVDSVDDTSYSGTFNFTASHPDTDTYVLKFKYVNDGKFHGASVDNISVIENIDRPEVIGSYVFRLEDGQQQPGFVLTSDSDGNATWKPVATGLTVIPQGLVLSSNTLSITEGNSVDLSDINKDEQIIDELSFDAATSTLSLSVANDNELPKTVVLSSLIGTDNQTIDRFQFANDKIKLSLEDDNEGNKVIDLSSYNNPGTDDQKIDELSFNSSTNILSLSIEDDGDALKTVSLNSLVGTDNQFIDKFELDGNKIKLSIDNDGVVADEEIDLSVFNNTGTDDQKIDLFQLNGNNLELSLEDDGQSKKTVNISSITSGLFNFTNGLTESSGTVKLGGALVEDTLITSNGFFLEFRGNNKTIFETNASEDYITFGGGYSSPDDDDNTTFTDSALDTHTMDFVAGFHNGDTGGTAIQTGSIEYIVDGTGELFSNSSFSPLIDNTYNSGSASKRWSTIYSTSGAVNTSDMNLKKNVKNLTYGLNEVLKLKTITYNWKDNTVGKTKIPSNLQERKIGFSAQQLLEVLPETVQTHSWVAADEKGNYKRVKNKNLGVFYSDIIPVTVKAIQEQQLQIDDLKARALKLIKEIESLKK